MKKLVTILLVTLSIAVGYTIGRHNTIISAELYNITEDGYDISFDDEVHSYSFD